MEGTSQKLLVIDDDSKLNRLLTDYLGGMGFQFLTAIKPSEELKFLEREKPDLVILDIMLPEMDGLEVCRTIRKDSKIPIIMLTARGETTDRIVGLEIGADDYLPKPFEPRELVARIQSVLRRAGKGNDEKEERLFSGLRVNYPRQRVELDGKLLDLTTLEFECLALLTQHGRKILDRGRIMEALHGVEWDAYSRTVDINMSRLRQKLKDDSKHPRFIKTIWGSGYMFIGKEDFES